MFFVDHEVRNFGQWSCSAKWSKYLVNSCTLTKLFQNLWYTETRALAACSSGQTVQFFTLYKGNLGATTQLCEYVRPHSGCNVSIK